MPYHVRSKNYVVPVIVGLAVPIAIVAFCGVIILEIDDTVFKSSRHMLCDGLYDKVDRVLFKQKYLIDSHTKLAEKLSKSDKYSKFFNTIPNYAAHLADLRTAADNSKQIKTEVAMLQHY
ncbi:uncharacterized protein LOC113233938 [Hyposmocoma kahamanoa]|uniref:uncharacterized protein LOC113233938 n=1 Tax=Hyposmocoma kahamanoa TaxID=1477025 RepID=UPI000E6D633C|nr:uncharacterized protein LOC113233938 [Hyposmocoma kahamanoa]